MESLEISARTVEEAVKKALAQLNASRDEVEITVIKEGKGGVLGLGAEDAVVNVTLLEPDGNRLDHSEITQNIIEKLLDLMDVDGTVTIQNAPVVDTEEDGEAAGALVYNIEGDDLGILIGRRGQTLDCLQYLVRLIVGHQLDSWSPLVIDVEKYKQRRYRALQDLAREMAAQVKDRGTSFKMEPMPPAERRLIHLALVNHPEVYTESEGQGEFRRVIILPKDK